MRWGPALLIWFSVLIAVTLAVLGAWIANQFGAQTNLLTTGITALIVAVFLAILVFRPKQPKHAEEELPVDSGFKVLGGEVKGKVEEKKESSIEKLRKQ